MLDSATAPARLASLTDAARKTVAPSSATLSVRRIGVVGLPQAGRHPRPISVLALMAWLTPMSAAAAGLELEPIAVRVPDQMAAGLQRLVREPG